MSKKGRVLVAMSGGIDSSVAALLLKEQGYDLVGITMKTWEYESSGCSTKETGCCSIDSINDARNLAVEIGFPHYTFDFKKDFEEKIIADFISEYMSGRTPNPCVLCNSLIKWDALLEKADALDCDYIATGHYARVSNHKGRYFISAGEDITKDQSYVLWGLSQASLKRTLFPLGDMKKTEVRKIAAEKGFTDLATKRESYEICFVPGDDYRSFLKARIPDIDNKIGPGDFIFRDGKFIGKHKGYPYYTIGQRKGLEVAVGTPLYVLEIRPESNTVVLGFREELDAASCYIRNINLMKYEAINGEMEVITKIRYNDKGTESVLCMEGDKIKVTFISPVSAITPGQSAVFYEGNDLIGGGFID